MFFHRKRTARFLPFVAFALAAAVVGALAQPQTEIKTDPDNDKPSVTLSTLMEATLPQLDLGNGDLSRSRVKITQARAIFNAKAYIASGAEKAMFGAAVNVCDLLIG